MTIFGKQDILVPYKLCFSTGDAGERDILYGYFTYIMQVDNAYMPVMMMPMLSRSMSTTNKPAVSHVEMPTIVSREQGTTTNRSKYGKPAFVTDLQILL